MKIKNTRKKLNYINYKVNGVVKRIKILAGETVDVFDIHDLNQVINLKDFNIGFFEVVNNTEVVNPKKPKKKNKSRNTKDDSLEKIQKEVEDYINKDGVDDEEDSKQ